MNPEPIREGIVRRIRALLLRQVESRLGRNFADGADRRWYSARHEALHGRLRRYEEEIEQLRVENEHLRLSATTFGELAERLNNSLKNAGHGRTPLPGGS